MNTIVLIDAEQIAQWLRALVAPASTVEMRVLYKSGAPHIRHYESGDLLTMARDAVRLGKKADGVYWLLNPLPNEWCGSPATDGDIVRRRWLLVDFDPKRTEAVSSTDKEKELARSKMVEVDEFLSGRGWPAPIVADSGNGWHLLYQIDMPSEDDNLVHRTLRALAKKFDDEYVTIDTRVANPSRICKLYGTIARKGENTPDRPHRISWIVTVPESIELASATLLEELVNEVGAGLTHISMPSSLEITSIRDSYPEAIERARKYLAKMDPSISGNGGHDRLIRAASTLVNDFKLTDDEAFDLLLGEFNPRCQPPWDDHEVRRKIQEAKKNPPNRPAKGSGATCPEASLSDEMTIIINEPWPSPMDDAAFHGVVGEIVRKIEPHTEADRVALLIQALVAIGNVIGRNCYFSVEATRHYPNLFAVIVGSSSAGRKGTSGDQVNRIVRQVDEEWFLGHVISGLVSGEGLIWQVRDPETKQEPVREGGRKDGKVIDYQEVVTDDGISDKRLLAYETEFSALMKAKSREKNSLSETLRQAWDSGRLRTSSKNSPAKATDTHISLIGHVTPEELRQVSSEVDMVNGLANRFLWCCVKRSKLLAEGGNIHQVNFDSEIAELKSVVEFASTERRIQRDADATKLWGEIYASLTAERPGARGAICNRGAAQVVRLSLLYAILDRSVEINVQHLRAAIAVWDYCEASVKYIFGNGLANRTADTVLNALRMSGEVGMTRTAISNLFNRNKGKPEIDTALQLLLSTRLARFVKAGTEGRSAETWFAT